MPCVFEFLLRFLPISYLPGEINLFLKELKNEVLILISGKFLHLGSFSLLNYEANLLIRLFIHMPPEIHLIFILQNESVAQLHTPNYRGI
jgi:hypothetical protein